MTDKGTSAAGIILAISTLAGFFIGASQGQMSAGFVGGLGLGIVVAVVLWWRGR